MAYYPTPQIVVLVFQDPSGAPLANGYVTLRLNTDASVQGYFQISAGRVVTVNLDDTGSVNALLWPNDQLAPAGTVYFVKAYTALGQPVWDGELSVTNAILGDYILQEDDSLFLLEDSLTDALILEAGIPSPNFIVQDGGAFTILIDGTTDALLWS